MSGEVDRRERGPWRPARGEYVRLWPLPIEVPERAGFVLAVTLGPVVIAVLILLLVAML